MIIAVAVNAQGRREVLGITVMPSEAETFWTEFLRSLTRRGLRGVKLVISDAHEGLKAAAAKVLGASGNAAGSTSCETRWPASESNRAMVAAALRNTFEQPNREVAREQWNKLVDAFAEPADKLAKLMREAEDDVFAYMAFPKDHWNQLHSTNPLGRLNKEIKRRTNVIGIFPNDDAIIRLVGALMLEQNDEWAVTRRYMSLETVAQVCDDQTIDVARIAALNYPADPAGHAGYTTPRGTTPPRTSAERGVARYSVQITFSSRGSTERKNRAPLAAAAATSVRYARTTPPGPARISASGGRATRRPTPTAESEPPLDVPESPACGQSAGLSE